MEQKFTLWPDRPEVKHNLIRAINQLDSGREWDVRIKPHVKAKTVSQRGWWHKLLELWGIEIGFTQGQCKEMVKGYHFGWKRATVAGIEFMAADGSSEDENRVGYSALIETTYWLAAEMEVILPEADKFRNQAKSDEALN